MYVLSVPSPDDDPVTSERILQALNVVPTTDDVFRQCLHKLQAICGHHMTLPSSHNVSGDLARVGGYPISVDGGTADVWEGTHGGKKVCIKCPRVCMEDLRTVTQVRIQHRCISLIYSRKPACAVVVPQRGRHMEKVKTPERRPFHWCYERPFAICFGIYAERNPDEVRQE